LQRFKGCGDANFLRLFVELQCLAVEGEDGFCTAVVDVEIESGLNKGLVTYLIDILLWMISLRN
jgi:hypothetical protein